MHSKTKLKFFGMNANLVILFAQYENMSQNGHLLFKSSKNLRNRKARKPEWDQRKRNKFILQKNLEDKMLRQPKALKEKKRDPVILKDLFGDAY